MMRDQNPWARGAENDRDIVRRHADTVAALQNISARAFAEAKASCWSAYRETHIAGLLGSMIISEPHKAAPDGGLIECIDSHVIALAVRVVALPIDDEGLSRVAETCAASLRRRIAELQLGRDRALELCGLAAAERR